MTLMTEGKVNLNILVSFSDLSDEKQEEIRTLIEQDLRNDHSFMKELEEEVADSFDETDKEDKSLFEDLLQADIDSSIENLVDRLTEHFGQYIQIKGSERARI